jgi:RNA polymerase sigma-70 factor (ECF subfamily)
MLAARRGQFLSFARKRVPFGTDADAEDLLQQALLKATESVAAIREGERLDAWFYRVLRNVILDHHAGRARRESHLEALAREPSLAPADEGAVCACSLGVLETLRPEYADILRRVDLDGAPVGQTASQLGIDANNAKVRLHRARKAMRQALVSFCGTDSLRACLVCGCEEASARGPDQPHRTCGS